MLVFPNEALAVLAMPKTGTMALTAALEARAGLVLRDPPTLKHMPLKRFQREIVPLLAQRGVSDLQTVAMIREPRDWLSSWYRYRRRPQINGSPNSTAEMTFADFVQAYMLPEPPSFAQIGRQARFLEPAHNARPVDHLFRYEDQSAFLGFLETRLGFRVELPLRNASPPADTSLPAALEKELYQFLDEDFTLWASLAPPEAGLQARARQN